MLVIQKIRKLDQKISRWLLPDSTLKMAKDINQRRTMFLIKNSKKIVQQQNVQLKARSTAIPGPYITIKPALAIIIEIFQSSKVIGNIKVRTI